MSLITHDISVTTLGYRIPGWKNYSISTDMLQPADSFTLEVKFSRKAWQLLMTDQEVTIHVDGTKLLTGFVDERRKVTDRSGGSSIQINGRDKSGRLVDESSPLFRYGGLRLKDLAEKIAGVKDDSSPLFEQVTLQNTRNRSLLRNVKARKARTIKEPVLDSLVGTFAPILVPTVQKTRAEKLSLAAAHVASTFVPVSPQSLHQSWKPKPIIDPGIFRGRAVPKKVTPGSSRWAVLEEFIREARLLAWTTADGRELVVGLPNYDGQEPQYWFYESAGDQDTRDETNCTIEIAESVAERYSKITAVGSSRGTSSNYGKGVTKRRFTVLDNDQDPNGVGGSFGQRKELIITDDSIKSIRDAKERAEREQLERNASAQEIIVRTQGHSQLYAGETPAYYAIDTLAVVEDAKTGLKGTYLVTAVEYTHDRQNGTQTTLRLVPKGTLLQI